MPRLCIEQDAQTRSGVSEVRDFALGILVLPIEPLSQVPLRSCDVDRGSDRSGPPVVRSVLAGSEPHHDRFEDLGGGRDQMQRGFVRRGPVLRILIGLISAPQAGEIMFSHQ